MSVSTSDRRVTRLANPALRASLSAFVRARVPGERGGRHRPVRARRGAGGRAGSRRRRRGRRVGARDRPPQGGRLVPARAPRDAAGPAGDRDRRRGDSAPQSARDLLRWATRELPNGDENARTFEWMLREGAGEKLESIAADERLPAPRVRQRVSRLRKHYRARWAAALAALVLVAVAVGLALRKRPREEIAPLPSPLVVPSVPLLPPPAPVPQATPEERAAELRRDAFEKCAAGLWQDCVDGLDGARRLDPAGDSAPAVQAAARGGAAGAHSHAYGQGDADADERARRPRPRPSSRRYPLPRRRRQRRRESRPPPTGAPTIASPPVTRNRARPSARAAAVDRRPRPMARVGAARPQNCFSRLMSTTPTHCV